jgi:hypothetical protein
MGATNFQQSERGKSMSEAYKSACADAIEANGHQEGYNGTISTTSGYRDVTSDFKRSKLSLQKFINDNIDNCEKWGSAWGICIEEPKGNNNKVKSQVKHIVTKGTKKWVTKFVITSGYDRNEIGSELTKGKAVTTARKYTEKNQKTTYIHLEKRLVGEARVAEITYKQAINEKDGKFVFFGWAAE